MHQGVYAIRRCVQFLGQGMLWKIMKESKQEQDNALGIGVPTPANKILPFIGIKALKDVQHKGFAEEIWGNGGDTIIHRLLEDALQDFFTR